MEKEWIYPTSVDTSLVDKLKNETRTNLSISILEILINRGYDTVEKIDFFLNPIDTEFNDPFLMKDMDKAVTRLIDALIDREKILIWGDYDVDGVTSTSLLYLFIKSLGGDISYTIPDREGDGYGLSIEGVKKAHDEGIDLIITVDCGITSVEQAKLANEIGIDVIVSDHHEPGAELPSVCAVINPKRSDCKYPFKHLAGVGVAFKLVQGVLLQSEMDIEKANEYLDIVGIGTAADIVPLVEENRKIVSLGLMKLNSTKKIGLKALLKQLNLHDKEIRSNNIIFGIAPRVNAAGRMGDAKRSVELMISNDPENSISLVKELEEENDRRKQFDRFTLNEAIEISESFFNHETNVTNAIVVAKESWHVGVIGIVASRLVEKYHKPSVVISVDDGVGKGSCRSVFGINVYELLKDCSDLLIQFGGHEYAAGLLIEADKIDEFRVKFNNAVTELLKKVAIKSTLKVDSEISLEKIDNNLVDVLSSFEPYGPENSQPIFVAKGVEVVGSVRIVGINHLKLRLRQNGIIHDSIGFNLAGKVALVEENRDSLDLSFYIEKNNWNGKEYIQLRLLDVK